VALPDVAAMQTRQPNHKAAGDSHCGSWPGRRCGGIPAGAGKTQIPATVSSRALRVPVTDTGRLV